MRIETIGNATLYLADCRDALPLIGSVDAVIADPPYGTTQCSWDAVIPFADMWQALSGVAGKNCPIVLFGSEPFSSALRMSNIRQFKYDWIWDKPKATGFLNAKKQPLRGHEIISVFCDGVPPYHPQMSQGHARRQSSRGKHLQTDVYGEMASDYRYDSTERYPQSVITFATDTQNTSLHPTQKPVALMEYLVLTYTDADKVVADFAMGSGTTGVACMNTGRHFVGIERDPVYFDIACKRIEDALRQERLFA